jgi:diguanylate cyclase (GGDEF)-like protein
MNDQVERSNILIIDDELIVRNLIVELLAEKYSCETADSAEQALDILKKKQFDLILSDINLGGMSGIEIIPYVHESSPDTVVMMVSGEGTMEGAIAAMRMGAFDYISKPFDLIHVEIGVRRAIQHHTLLVAKRRHETQLEELVRQRTEELIHLSYHDSLTNLPNSILFEDRLSQAIVQASHHHRRLAMLYLSIDRFDQVYDTLGHKLGYELLKSVADRLRASVREDCTVARFEGNEFAVLLSQIDGSEDVIDLANDFYKALENSFSIDGKEIFISFSIGISIFPEDAVDGQKLLKNASAALAIA